jgi:hypothetical protein
MGRILQRRDIDLHLPAGVIPSGPCWCPSPEKRTQPRPRRFQLYTFYDCRQKLAGYYLGSNHSACIRFEKIQQINLQCSVSFGHNRFPKTSRIIFQTTLNTHDVLDVFQTVKTLKVSTKFSKTAKSSFV